MGQKSKSKTQRKQASAARPPVKKPRRLGVLLALGATAVLAVGGLVALQTWQRYGRGPAPVLPAQGAELNAQLQDYLPRFIEAVNANRSDYQAHGDLGLVYEANQFWQEARQCFANAVMLAPHEPLPRLHLGIVQYEMGEPDAAMATFRDLAKRSPLFAPGHHRLGTTALSRSDLTTADAAFRKVIELSPATHEGYIGLADVSIRNKDYEGAKALLDKALTIKPDNGTAHHLLGLAYAGMGREDDARRAMALGTNAGSITMVDDWSLKMPAHATGLSRMNGRAIALMNAGKLDEAALVYTDALRYYPDNPDVLNNLSIVRDKQGRRDEALQLLLRATAANPRHHATYSNLATHYHAGSQTPKAIEEMRKALALAPADAAYHRKMASMLGSLRQYEESRVHWQEATKYDPNHVNSFVRLAEVCAELDRKDEARAALERAQRLAPNDPSVVALASRLGGANP